MWTYTMPVFRSRDLPSLNEILEDPVKYHIEQRDLYILETLFFRRFLTSEQIRREFFQPGKENAKGMKRTSQARLKLLYERCLIDRFRPPSMKGDGSHPYVYTVDRPGYELLRYFRPDRVTARWQFREKVLQFSKVIHELELNEFCLTTVEEAKRRGILMHWLTTREVVEKVKGAVGGKSPLYAPDAMLIWKQKADSPLTETVIHVEYERSCDKRWFQDKMKTWRLYRKEAQWKRKYPREPKILVVGRKKAMPRAGWGSIEPLRELAKVQHFEGIFFLYLEDLQMGKWEVINPRDEQTNLWNLQETDSWKRMRQE